jgi:hypothetical protein
MFVATPITMLVNQRDAEAQVWKPRSKKKGKAKPAAEPKAKAAVKSSRKAKAKSPTRAKKKAAAKKKVKSKKARKPVDEDDDFAIFEETEGDLER